MAEVITPNSEVFAISPVNGEKFSIAEIIIMLGGPLDVMLMKDLWIFSHKHARELQLKRNDLATVTFNSPIYGTCFVAYPDELTRQFFLPSEDHLDKLQQKIKELEASSSIEENKLQKENGTNPINSEEYSKEINDATVNLKEQGLFDPNVAGKNKEELINHIYEVISNKRDEYVSLDKGMELYKSKGLLMVIPPDKEHRLLTLQKFINHFMEKEMYEQCSTLQEIYNILNDSNN